MRAIEIITQSMALIVACKTAVALDGHAGQVKPAREWQQVWSDEFSQDGRPDPRNWTYESGFVRNRELQWYQAENAWCERGFLIIEARRQRIRNPNFDSENPSWARRREYSEYTSASLRTDGLQCWKYGRFEMRARINSSSGLWPAFWMMGTRGEWPQCGEIDVMEFYRDTLLANVAWGTDRRWVPHWDSAKWPIAQFSPDWSDQFHIWRMDWSRKAIRLYVDDQLLNATNLTETLNKRGAVKNPFHQPHFLLLSLAVGGTNGGDPRRTAFPARLEVDYVRVSQRLR